MDSRLIYSAINSIKHKIIWENKYNNEWIYVGVDNEINEEFIYQKIEELFGTERLLLALDRNRSKVVEKADLKVTVIRNIRKENFIISDEKFKKFIEFNKIGIIRIGKIA